MEFNAIFSFKREYSGNIRISKLQAPFAANSESSLATWEQKLIFLVVSCCVQTYFLPLLPFNRPFFVNKDQQVSQSWKPTMEALPLKDQIAANAVLSNFATYFRD